LMFLGISPVEGSAYFIHAFTNWMHWLKPLLTSLALLRASEYELSASVCEFN
jgi:hypothetical protein